MWINKNSWLWLNLCLCQEALPRIVLVQIIVSWLCCTQLISTTDLEETLNRDFDEAILESIVLRYTMDHGYDQLFRFIKHYVRGTTFRRQYEPSLSPLGPWRLSLRLNRRDLFSSEIFTSCIIHTVFTSILIVIIPDTVSPNYIHLQWPLNQLDTDNRSTIVLRSIVPPNLLPTPLQIAAASLCVSCPNWICCGRWP